MPFPTQLLLILPSQCDYNCKRQQRYFSRNIQGKDTGLQMRICGIILLAIKHLGFIEEFSIMENSFLPKKLLFSRIEGEWFLEYGRHLIIIAPKGWNKYHEADTAFDIARPPTKRRGE